MRTGQLLKRNLTYFWRTNLAVVAGVATAVAVLAGALLVGDSVRASLRDIFLQRLGATDRIVTSTSFFREQLSAEIQSHQNFHNSGFTAVCPLVAMEGAITHEQSGRVGTGVRVYGVDERFWSFHGRQNLGLSNREIVISEALATELGAKSTDELVLRLKKPTAIPAESLHSRKEELGETLRLQLRAALPPAELGEFSLQPQQGAVRAAFVPLSLLQRELAQPGKVNLLLISENKSDSSNTNRQESIEKTVREKAALDDLGITLRVLEGRAISFETDSKLVNKLISDAAGAAAAKQSLNASPVFSYLANTISANNRSIPYSLITALDQNNWPGNEVNGQRSPPGSDLPPITLNDWAARDLGVGIGDTISIEYYLWEEGGRLVTRKAEFVLTAIVPIAGLAADRDLVPQYPGITGTEDLSDWDPPFPVDLSKIRPQDEEYWDQYKTTPKAFIPLAEGQRLWQSRYGNATSLRLTRAGNATLHEPDLVTFGQQLRASIDPVTFGFTVIPVRSEGLQASRGATNFGEYFLYFSFFLVVSALMLAALFFKVGIEQRLREIGILQTVGFPLAKLRKLFGVEGFVLSLIGSLIGIAGAIVYGKLLITGLTTWWVGAVGTTALTLHITPMSLTLGVVGGIVSATLCIFWTLRRVTKNSTRSLLAGSLQQVSIKRRETGSRLVPSRLTVAIVLGLLGLGLLGAAALKIIGETAGFFGGGLLLLVSFLVFLSAWLHRTRANAITGNGWWPVSRLGFRNTTYRPGRSVLCIGLIASAAFIIVSVDAFRRKGGDDLDQKSGTGGFPLLAESLLPLVHDPNSAEGRAALNIEAAELADTRFVRFRLRPGDDASCLNLYQPRNPKVVAPTDDFIQSNRFAFQSSLAESQEEKNNPWLLLNRQFPDGAIPVVADAISLNYVLHLKPGDDLVLNQETHPIRLRVVGALADSIFQSELLMSESNFLRVFPEQEGFRFFLIETPASGPADQIAAMLEERLVDFGFDVTATPERLANFHRVENTYLSTFQMLGGLGLILGTFGLAAVLLRNVFERRRELALLRAVGYQSSHFTVMVVAENVLLLLLGLAVGTVCALLAISPVFFERGGRLPNISLGILLIAVLVSGLTASIIATWAALRSPLLPALRAE